MELINRTNFAFAPITGRVNFPAHTATLVVKAGFRLVPGGVCEPLETPAPLEGDVMSKAETPECLYDADLAYFKPKTDLLLTGACHTPGNKPMTTCPVTFRVGGFAKTIAAIGNRTWQKGVVRSKPTEPEPFTTVALTWANAFGAPKFDDNPAGKGHKDGLLPNLEDPDRLITGYRDKPRPACFGPVHRTWRLRTDKLGDYDKKWLKERWPAFPANFDWTYFNAAPPDQQLEGFLRGDEEIELTNMRPERAVFKTRLPGLRVRVIVREHDELKPREVNMNLDTLFVDAAEQLVYLTWRGVANVGNDDWDECRDILVVSESLSDDPRTIEQLLPLFTEPADELEIDEPESPEVRAARVKALDAEIAKVEGLAAKYEQEALKKVQASLGKDADLKALTAAKSGGFADIERAFTRALKKESAEALGLPPGFNIKEYNPANIPEVKKAMQVAKPKPPKPADKNGLTAVLKSGEAGGGDFSGADLSGEDLSGADLRDCIFNGANLSGAKLADAKLAGASFLDADLTGADFTGADLSDADLTRAKLDNARFVGANLQDANFTQCQAEGADFSETKAKAASFIEARAEGAVFKAAELPEAVFSMATLTKADFSGATLTEASFDRAIAHEANFEEAVIENLRAEAADFTGAKFTKAKGKNAVFEKAILAKADFGEAELTDALLPLADLSGARLYGADLTGAMLRRAKLNGAQAGNANFFKALLEKADLTDASLVTSNFYGADFLEAVTKGADLEGANLGQTKLAE